MGQLANISLSALSSVSVLAMDGKQKASTYLFIYLLTLKGWMDEHQLLTFIHPTNILTLHPNF